MPFYAGIDNSTADGRRTAKNLLTLRKQLTRDIPARGISGNLLIATWNIREFESPAYGPRPDEAIYYIAEIISRFDVVALQEVREDLSSLERVRAVLGRWWKVLVTDVTEGQDGNDERTAILYDARKLTFSGLASEVVLPPIEKKGVKPELVRQPSRSPFVVGFDAGWFRFSLCTTHMLYGSGKREDALRTAEIRAVASFLAQRAAKKTADAWSRNVVLLGDFNIFGVKDESFKALVDAGFSVPEKLVGIATNATHDRTFDQIALKSAEGGFIPTGNGGVFNYYESIYRDADAPQYARAMGAKYSDAKDAKSALKYFRTYWRTYQMSDHLPLWVELNTDFSDYHLAQKAKAPARTNVRELPA